MGEYFPAELDFGPASAEQAGRVAELAGVPGPHEPVEERGCAPLGPARCWRIFDYRATFGLEQFAAARAYLRGAGIGYVGCDDGWIESDGMAVDWRPGLGPDAERERANLPVAGPCLSAVEWRAICERADRLAGAGDRAGFIAGQVAEHFRERFAPAAGPGPEAAEAWVAAEANVQR